MIPDEKHIELLQDLLAGKEMDPSSLKLLFKFYNSEKGHSIIGNLLSERWPGYQWDNTTEVDSLKIWNDVNKSIQADAYRRISRSVALYKWVAGIAAVLFIALLTTTLVFFELKPQGRNMAAVLNEVIAPAGYIKDFRLPDGTRVWLNPGSSLTYSENMMNEGIRDVRLWGQAYFDVAPGKENPFILQLGDVGLKVTGTSFNARNYKDDTNIEIVLKTGEVKLFEGFYADAVKFTLLQAGEMARFTKGTHEFKIEKTNVDKYISWTQGILMFRDNHLSEVFKQMERWYNVRILVEDPEINNYLFTATIKNEKLDRILRLIEYTSNLECKPIKSNSPKIIIMVRSKKSQN